MELASNVVEYLPTGLKVPNSSPVWVVLSTGWHYDRIWTWEIGIRGRHFTTARGVAGSKYGLRTSLGGFVYMGSGDFWSIFHNILMSQIDTSMYGIYTQNTLKHLQHSKFIFSGSCSPGKKIRLYGLRWHLAYISQYLDEPTWYPYVRHVYTKYP